MLLFVLGWSLQIPGAAEGESLSTAVQLAWAQSEEALEEHTISFERQDVLPACPSTADFHLCVWGQLSLLGQPSKGPAKGLWRV